MSSSFSYRFSLYFLPKERVYLLDAFLVVDCADLRVHGLGVEEEEERQDNLDPTRKVSELHLPTDPHCSAFNLRARPQACASPTLSLFLARSRSRCHDWP